MLALGVGNAWAEEEATITFSEKGLENGVQYSDPFEIDANTTIVFAGGSNDGKYYNTGSGIRTYGEGSMTIACTNGTISEISFTWHGTSYEPTSDVANPTGYSTSTDKWTGSASSVTLTRPSGSGHWRLQEVTVIYTLSSGGETPGTSGGSANVTYDFTKIDGFNSWPTSYANGKGDVVYTEATVKFTGAVKQTQTITDCPVTKGGQVQLVLNEAYADRDITNITFVCRQWGPKTQTITLHYSTDKGVSYTTTEITSTNFTISSAELPEGTNAVKITFSSSSNQVGIESVTFSLSSGEGSSSGETPELTNDQFAWSAATAEATMGASNTFPTLTNTLSVPVTYESSTPATATIAADGSITLVAPGTTTISAKFAGGEVSGTTYVPKTVTYALTVHKAPATPTENVYVKVTETAGITDGEYLIVYEDGKVAFNGALATLDAVSNTVEVTISDNVVVGNTEIDAATFTIDAANGTILSASGKYIGVTSYDNGLKQNEESSTYGAHSFEISEGNAIVKIVIADKGDMILNYNPSTNNGQRFRYYKEGSQKPIALYKKVDPSEILAPAFSVAAGSFYDAQSVVITCATPGAEIYYTLDGLTPSSTSTKYTSAIAISETKTLKAIAIKGEYSSSVTEATYTILAPLATMQEIFDKAKAVGTTATPVKVTMNNWVVTGVKGSNAYLTDGTKGLIIYTASHGFVVGDVLSGTVACKVQLYNGSSELTELTKTTEGLTVTTGGTVTPVVVNDVTTLSGVNTGSVIKITGICESGNVVAGAKLFETLYTFDNLTVGNKYNVTGVYLQYGDVEEILPRKQEDIEEVQDLATATISVSNISLEVDETKTIEATITPDAAKTKVQYAITAGSEYITLNGATITGVAEGTATVTATIAEAAGEYYGTTKDFTVTVTPKSTKDKVVILAQYNGQWYAMMAQYVSGKTSHLAALPVNYVGGKLYNVADADKTLIEWDRAVVDGKATFSNNSKYLTGKSDKTDLTLTATSCNWTISGESYLIGERTFFYNAENNWFRNFKIENVDAKNYSGMPVVAAPVYVNLNTASVKTVENAYFSVGDNKYVQFSTGNLQYEVGTNTWSFASKQYEVIGGDAYTGSNNTNKGMNVPGYTGKLDLFAWSADGKFGVNPSNKDADYQQAFVDWGTLVNESGWYTLTQAEMRHILNRTKDGKKLWALATVNGLNGLILLPDNWNTSISLVYGYVPTQFVYTENQLTIAQWETLEAEGAVFLPAAGSRTGGYGNTEKADGKGALDANNHYFHVNNVGDYGYYWLNTQDTRPEYPHCASYLILPGWDEGPIVDDEGIDDLSLPPTIWSREKRRGNSVRLVKVVEPDYTREGQGAGVYGTVCYPENIVWVDGATLYEVAGKEGNKVIFDEVTTPEAGMPYIFIADQEVINFFCGTDEALLAGNYNSLQGTFETIQPAETNILTDNYVLYNNIIKKCGANCGLNAYRAYFIGTTLEDLGSAPSPIQGRRRISLDVQSENTTTDLENILNGENTTIKVIENGQLIIIRNGDKFNAQGVRL